MSADELRELAAVERIEIGSHTRTHDDLSQATESEAYEEMVACKRDLEQLIGRPVTSFAYPYGPYSSACPEAARRAGYAIAATCGLLGGWAVGTPTSSAGRASARSTTGSRSPSSPAGSGTRPSSGRLAARLARRSRHGR